MNVRMAKAFRTSREALCILTGLAPIILKTEQTVKKYIAIKGSQTHLFDSEVELKNWPHLADDVNITETKEYNEQKIQAYRDGSKNVHGVGSGVAIFVDKALVAQLNFKLYSRCSNNRAVLLTIVKALEVIELKDISENSPRTVTLLTDSSNAINSLKNVNKHGYLMEEFRKTATILERLNWTKLFSWVKAHI